jgi:hypothetical protein
MRRMFGLVSSFANNEEGQQKRTINIIARGIIRFIFSSLSIVSLDDYWLINWQESNTDFLIGNPMFVNYRYIEII